MLTAVSLLMATQAYGICPTEIATPPNCTAPTCMSVSGSHLNISPGQIYCIPAGTSVTLSGVNIGGGELRVCGQLNLIGTFNANAVGPGNKVSISPDGTLSVSADINLSATRFENMGKVVTQGNIHLNAGGGGNKFINEVSSELHMDSTGSKELIINNNSNFYNAGKAYLNRMRTNHGGEVCMNNEDPDYLMCVDEGLTANQNNVFQRTASSSSTMACMNIAGVIDFQNINSFASDALTVLLHHATGLPTSIIPPVGTSDTGGKWGDATAFNTGAAFICDPTGAPLPIKLVKSSAQMKDDGTVDVKWTTATERDSDQFEIERSNDGRNFTRIGNVKASGESITNKDYLFTDTNPSPDGEHLYYRLRMLDIDSSSRYSPVMHVRVNTVGKTSFQNPQRAGQSVRMNIHANSSKTVEVSVIDISGRRISSTQKQVMKGNNNVDLPSIPTPGTYIIMIDSKDGSRPVSNKIVIQ